ncbi:MAG: response regulator transcription factor [Actinomycetota bacterium]
MRTIGALIVDDQEDVRHLVRITITAADNGLYVLAETDSGQGAIDSIDYMDPDVIIMDMMMPGMNGLDAAERILELRPGQRFILYSAYLDRDVLRRADQLGIEICLSKERLEDIPNALWAAAK